MIKEYLNIPNMKKAYSFSHCVSRAWVQRGGFVKTHTSSQYCAPGIKIATWNNMFERFSFLVVYFWDINCFKFERQSIPKYYAILTFVDTKDELIPKLITNDALLKIGKMRVRFHGGARYV